MVIIKVGLILAFLNFSQTAGQNLLLPISILTLGLIRIIINTLGLYLAVFLVSAFTVSSFTIYGWSLIGFWAYLGTSFLLVSFFIFQNHLKTVFSIVQIILSLILSTLIFFKPKGEMNTIPTFSLKAVRKNVVGKMMFELTIFITLLFLISSIAQLIY